MTSFPTSAATPLWLASVPSTVVSGAPLKVVVTATKGRDQALELFRTVRFQVRVELEEEPIWGLGQPALEEADILADSVSVAMTDAEESRSKAKSARTYSIPTSPEWAGVLVVTITAGEDKRVVALPVALVRPDELSAFESEVANLAGVDPDSFRPANPVRGTNEFWVAHVMQDSGRLAEQMSELVGPVIRVNVRNHQESLAVMGQFENRAPWNLQGAPDVLRVEISKAIGAVRRHMDEPNAVRLAFHVLVRAGLRGQPAGPVIFLEISAPKEQPLRDDEIGHLQTELTAAVDETVWGFLTRYEENRIRVFGRIGPFAVASADTAPRLGLE